MKNLIAKIILLSFFVSNGNFILFNNTYAASAGDILITEVEYDPATPLGHTSAEVESEAEWFELYNPTGLTIDIGGWTIKESGAPTYTFPSSTNIVAGGFLLVTNRVDRFQLNYIGITPDLEMDPNGTGLLKLNNTSGDSLTLKDDLGTTIDHMAWEGVDGFNINADAGFSACRRNLNDTGTDSEWANNCTPTPGTGTFVTQFPGGVPVASLLWGKADSENYSHGDTVTTFNDRSGNDRNGTANGNPNFDTTNTINFYPTISFDGTADGVDFPRYSMPTGDKNYTVYTVFQSDLSQNGTLAYVGKDYGTNNNTNLILKSDGSLEDDFDNGIANQNFSSAGTISSNTPSIVSFNYNTNNNDKNIFYNGKNVANKGGIINHNASNAITGTAAGTSDRGLGFNADASSRGVTANNFKGNIAEILSYDSELSSGDRQKIDSYLALKYGITLDQTSAYNYINSSGAVLWDSTTNASYTNDVIGIGKNNLSDLDQKVSKSINSGSVLTLATTNDFTSLNTDISRISLSDGNFLVVGNNAGAITNQTTELDTGLYINRITREWKVANTGGVGSVNLKFDGFDDSYVLLKNNDGDFSSATKVGNLSASGAIQVILNDGEYFTLAQPVVDIIAPVLTLSGQTIMYVSLNGNFLDPLATALDDIDGILPITTSGSVDTSHTGTTLITYSATDIAGNLASIEREVIVYEGVLTGETYSYFNGIDASCNMGSTYELKDNGDYIQFEAKFNDNFVNGFNKSLGLFGLGNGATTQTMGFLSNNNFYVRGSNSTWMTFTGLSVIENEFNTYKILINGANLELYINATLVGTTTLIETISVSHIANTYAANFAHADVKNVDIHTSVTGNIVSTDIDGDFSCVNNKVYSVIINDTIPPVVTLSGSNVIYIPLNGTYTELGATALDDVDGVISVTYSGGVDTSITGTNIISYSATDLAGNTGFIEREVIVYLGNLTNNTYSSFNGVDAFCSMGSTYEIKDDGDYIEFEARFNDNFTNSYFKSLGLFGVNGGSNQTIGFISNNNFYIRGTSNTWMTFTGLTVTEASFNTYKVIVNGVNLDLYINGNLAGNTAFINPFSVSNIANTYASNFAHADVKNIDIHTAITGDIQSNDIDGDFSCTNNKVYKTIANTMQSGSLVIDVQENQILIYKPITNNEYVRYDYRHITNNTKNLNAWTIYDANIVNSDLQYVRKITELGNWETAIKISGADDFMGGNAHGDEILTNFTTSIDNNIIDISKYGKRIGSSIKFTQDSNLFAPVGLTNVGTNVATDFKKLTFNYNSENNFEHNVTWLTSETLADAYLFMLPMARNTLEGQVTDVQRVASLYENVDISSNGHSAIKYIGNDFGGIVNLYGKDDNIFSHIKILNGWKNTSEYNTSPSTIYNKMYFDFTGANYTTSIGEVLNSEVNFDLGIDNIPTNLLLDNNNINENISTGALVGNLSTIDVDSGETYLYSFTGSGNDNIHFSLSGSQLLTGESFDFETKSSYTIRIMTDDIKSGLLEKEFTITINDLDDEGPVVILNGNATENILLNGTFIDLYANWTDNVDGTGSLTSVNSGSVDFSTLGTYILEYTKIDATGNAGNTVIRTINVVSGNAPVITLNGSGTITQEVGTIYTGLGAEYSDTEDGTGSVVGSGAVDINTVGTYLIKYNFTDTQANQAVEVARSVIIEDTTIPVITLTGATLNLLKGTTFIEPGNSCSDNYDTICAVIITGDTVDINTIGTYIIKYNVTDGAGNSAVEKERIVNIISGDVPVITLNGAAIVTQEVGENYIDLGAEYLDTEDVTGSIVGSGTVNINVVGSYIISYSFTDSSGNIAPQKSRTVIIEDATLPVAHNSSSGGYSKSKKKKGNLEKNNEKKDEENKKNQKLEQAKNIVKDPLKNFVNEIKKSKEVNGKLKQYALHREFKSCTTIDNLLSYEYDKGFNSKFKDIDKLSEKRFIMYLEKSGVISGTKENNFEPYRKTSRVEFIKIILRSHCIEYREEDSSDLNFTDLDNTSWEAKVVKKAIDLGIVNGERDGKGNKIFRANDIISSIEATKILMRMALIQKGEEPDSGYSDLNINWHKKYVNQGEYLDIFNAEKDNYRFNPNEGINRLDTTTFLYKVIRLYR